MNRFRRFAGRGQAKGLAAQGPAHPALAAAVRPAVERLEDRTLMSVGPRIWSVSPAPASTMAGDGFAVTVWFDEPMEDVTASDFVLTNAATGATVPGQIVQQDRYIHNHAVSLRYFGDPGQYTFRAISGADHLHGYQAWYSAEPLDGENTGALPSGDGNAGGDYVTSWTLTPLTDRPAAPSGLNAQPISSHEIELLYTLPQTAYGTVIERAAGNGPFQEIRRDPHQASDASQRWLDSTAEEGQSYRYRVRYWVDSGGVQYSDWSDEVSAQALPASLALPVSSLSGGDVDHPDWLTAGDNGTVFFTGTVSGVDFAAPPTTADLWKSDGTAAGTVKLHSGRASDLLYANGTLYFAGEDADGGVELWKSDGTAAGTVRVSDIVPGTASSNPKLLAAVGGNVFFGVRSAGGGYELWKTDGSAGGTARVGTGYIYLENIPSNEFDSRRVFAASGGYLYFTAADTSGSSSTDLQRTDGTAVTPISGAANAQYLADLNGSLYFIGDTVQFVENGFTWQGRGLLKVESTAAATVVKDFSTAGSGQVVRELVAAGGALYFSAPNSFGHNWIWRSDGTAAGTSTVDSLSNATMIYRITPAAHGVYFYTSEIGTYAALGQVWYSDGTSAGTVKVRAYDALPTTDPTFLVTVGDRAAYTDGANLWYSDGSYANTWKIDDVGVAAIGTPPNEIVYQHGFAGNPAIVVGDKVFFSTEVSDGVRQLRVTSLVPPADPTSASTGSAAVSSFALRAASTGGAQLTWHDNANNEAGYLVERYSAGGILPDQVFRLSADAASLNDPSGTSTSLYRIRAFNGGGYSGAALANAAPLTADIVDVSPDPRTSAVTSITITFSRPVFGLNLADLRLTRDVSPNLLGSATKLTTADNKTYTLSGLAGVTAVGGHYELRLVQANSGIRDGLGRTISADVTDTWTNTTPLPAAYQQGTDSNALVAIDAEKPDGNVIRNGKSWQKVTGTSYAGGAAMKANPNSGTTITTSVAGNSPRLDYRINFKKTGIHYVWIRGLAASTADDTVHVGLDGVLPSSSDNISGFGTALKWSKSTLDGALATINVTSTGVHTLNLWMREDGFVADKIVLTTSSGYAPSGSGPTASAHVGVTPQPPPPPPSTTVHVRAGADALVRDGTYAGKNFGAQTTLEVRQSASAGSTRQTYLRFDTSAASIVNNVKLRLFGKLSDSAATKVNVGVYAASNTSWGESSITWSNHPAAGTTPLGSIGVTGTGGQWFELDLTSFIKSERAAGRKVVTLVLKASATSSPYVIFNSDEASSNRPELVVS